MDKNEYWKRVCDKYPQCKDEEAVIKLRARGLRRMIEQAMELAVEDIRKGVTEDKNFERLFRKFVQ